ncbi:MAG TPA: HD domain-containing protein [Pseudonocardiaceae bacterium]
MPRMTIPGLVGTCSSDAVDLDFQEVIRAAEELVRDELGDEPTGHDWWHADRVRTLAVRFARQEGADVRVVELAALLHDLDDYKFSGSDDAGPRRAYEWLRGQGIPSGTAQAVAAIIANMSFKGAGVLPAPLSIEGKCVQDADRLDAIGAIGIARTFAYGGFVNRPIHDPSATPELHDSVERYRTVRGTTVNHFHEKLLLLKTRMNTESARQLAERRHEVLVAFLRQFHAEWEGSA